jgi:transposase-like protein
MPQKQLPIFPDGVTEITPSLAAKKEGGQVVYFNGMMPIFTHAETDEKSFQMIIAQFCRNGNVKQAEVARIFGIPAVSVKRWVKKYDHEGVAGFYKPRRRRGAAVLTAAVLAAAQQGLDEGLPLAAVAVRVGVKKDTLRKAVEKGKLKKK